MRIVGKFSVFGPVLISFFGCLVTAATAPGAETNTAPFSCATIPAPSAGTKHLASSALPPPPSAIGEKRILLYRIDFSDAVGAAIASNSAAALILDLNNYYHDMSYGQMTFALAEAGSVVTETLRLPEASTAYDNNFTKLINATRQVATNAGYLSATFDFDIICTGGKPFLVFGAVSYVGGPGVWLGNNNFNVGVAGHELGHNLGLPHASFWTTSDQSSIGPGAQEEYGDPFDSMGVPGGSTSHFNARFKSFVGWIPDADAPVVSANGTYRIMAHDQPTATGLRALRIPRSSSQNYWIEFRQSFNNRFVTNGASLRWAGNDATNTLLLDTTPGTALLKQDCPILIGRTFSDRCIDVHITPIGKGGTTPESLDVVVNHGPFPGNVPPQVTFTASATTVAANVTVTLQATATDANGDTLAYYWDFGDGNFGGNQASIQYAWTRDGEYVARCTVTDMKGGTASTSVVMRVGAVTTFLAEGHVRDQNENPIEGALVKAGTRFTYSDSDGHYQVSRLAAGRQTLSAISDGLTILNNGFDNPITVGPNAAGLDFIALPFGLNNITLVATGSVWKYLDTGSPPDSAWTTQSYDDTSWKSGRTKLGYGVGGETTLVGFGPNASDRYMTTWFRQRFKVEDVALINHLVFRLRRDDGVIVYLNGQELYRENMPSGPVTATTAAVVDVNSSEELVFFKRWVATNGLVTGTNLLAVEVHQFRSNSPDLSFDLEIVGMTDNPQTLLPTLTAQRSGTNVTLSWPAAYSGWTVYSAANLNDLWKKGTASVVVSNALNNVFQSPTNSSAFFRLRRPTFCSPGP